LERFTMLYTESWESGSVQAKPYQPRDIVVDRTHDGNSLPKAFKKYSSTRYQVWGRRRVS
jgi:hypothetical protein